MTQAIAQCINRNIVECKAGNCRQSTEDGCCINRNIVECKGMKSPERKWNILVLIETLWNVKQNRHLDAAWKASINRNIVECKDGQLLYRHFVYYGVLIETLWNVKLAIARAIWNVVSGINRNIVECKVRNQHRICTGRPVLIETLWIVKPVQAVYAQTIAAPY